VQRKGKVRQSDTSLADSEGARAALEKKESRRDRVWERSRTQKGGSEREYGARKLKRSGGGRRKSALPCG